MNTESQPANVIPTQDTAAMPSSSSSPFHLKTILVPVDFSHCGFKALQYAIPLARQYGSTLVVLYVVQEPYPVTEFGGMAVVQMETDLCAQSTMELNKFVEKEIHGVPTVTRVILGAPEIQIVEVAKTENVDLIVVSTHGRTGLKHVFLGSVVENVVRHAPCPVLVVREKEHEFLTTAAV